jgi:hypothetical protein
MNNDQVGRAALYDHEDFECVAASSKKGQFDVEADDVRKVSYFFFVLNMGSREQEDHQEFGTIMIYLLEENPAYTSDLRRPPDLLPSRRPNSCRRSRYTTQAHYDRQRGQGGYSTGRQRYDARRERRQGGSPTRCCF